MKTRRYSFLFFLLCFGMFVAACDENDIDASYQRQGTATATIASLSASKTTAAPSEEIVLTLKYRSPSTDPVESVTLRAKVGTNDYVEIETFAEGGAGTGNEISRTVNYTLPDVVTTVIFDMVITSQKEYPQVRRATVNVK